jgi:folate-binding protein YgfZ
MTPEPTPQTFFQYISLRDGCGIVDLADWSSVVLTGADRQSFLNNFCTNDVKRLAPGESCEAFFCNVKGKIMGHGLVTCQPTELVIVGPPGQGAALTSHLERYVIREDVAVRDTTAERAYTLLAGGAHARSTALALAPSIDLANVWQKPLVNGAARVVDTPAYWIHWELFGPWFAGLIESSSSDSGEITKALVEREATICNEFAFQIMRIEAGTPLFGIDFDDSNLPQEVGRNEQAINFTKGCYLGQETVARIDALGHVNRRLIGVAIECRETPPVGTELSAGSEKVGHITSATFSPALGAQLGLAMIRRGHNDAGTKLDSAVGEWEVIELPVKLRPAPT